MPKVVLAVPVAGIHLKFGQLLGTLLPSTFPVFGLFNGEPLSQKRKKDAPC
jgi:hypothetical protein